MTGNAPLGASHLRDYLRVLWRRRWAGLTCAVTVVSTVTIAMLLQRPIYRATAKILIEPEAPRVIAFQEVSPIEATQDYYQTQYEIMRSRPLVEKVVARLDLVAQRPALAAARDPIAVFLRSVAIEPIRNSRLVGISVEDADPVMAATIANLFASLYVEDTISTRVDTARRALGWLSDQLVDLKAKAQDAEVALQRYKEETGLIAVEEKQDITVKKLEEFNSEYIGAKAARLELETQLVELRRALRDRSRLEAAPAIVRNALVQKLRADMIGLQVRRSELKQTYTDKHPEVLKVRSQIAEIEREIAAEISRAVRSAETEYAALRAREEAMLGAVSQYKGEVQNLAKSQIQYGVLKREADSAQEMYDLLLKRVKETTLEGGLPASNVRVVEEAAPPRLPAKPNTPLVVGLGIVVGLLLGVGGAFFTEYMDATVRGPRDVEALTGLKVVATVPVLAGAGDDNG